MGLVLIVMFATGCGSASPTSPGDATVPGEQVPSGKLRYHVSGVVTDDSGHSIADTPVFVSYGTSGTFATLHVNTRTNAAGLYEATFITDAQGLSAAVGIVFAGSNWTVKSLPWGIASVVRDLRMRQIPTISAGQTIVVSIDSESSLAWDGDTHLSVNTHWEKVDVQVPAGTAADTLTVVANPADGAGAVPLVEGFCVGAVCPNATRQPTTRPEAISLPVSGAGGTYHISLEIPIDMAPERYVVRTSLR
jgi:hypothetical protein